MVLLFPPPLSPPYARVCGFFWEGRGEKEKTIREGKEEVVVVGGEMCGKNGEEERRRRRRRRLFPRSRVETPPHSPRRAHLGPFGPEIRVSALTPGRDTRPVEPGEGRAAPRRPVRPGFVAPTASLARLSQQVEEE